jgi:hypothetical protein
MRIIVCDICEASGAQSFPKGAQFLEAIHPVAIHTWHEDGDSEVDICAECLEALLRNLESTLISLKRGRRSPVPDC